MWFIEYGQQRRAVQLAVQRDVHAFGVAAR